MQLATDTCSFVHRSRLPASRMFGQDTSSAVRCMSLRNTTCYRFHLGWYEHFANELHKNNGTHRSTSINILHFTIVPCFTIVTTVTAATYTFDYKEIAYVESQALVSSQDYLSELQRIKMKNY